MKRSASVLPPWKHILQRFTVFLIILFVGFGARAAESEANPEDRFTNAQGYFRIHLPANWKEMNPKLAITFIDVEKTGPAVNVEAFGYQLSATNEPLDLPFITVQLARSGGLSGSALDMLKDEDVRRNGALLRLRGEGIREQDIDNSSYDPVRGAWRIDYRKEDEKRGSVRAIDYVVFVGRGSVNITCIAGAASFDGWSPTFEEALRSFEVDASLHSQLASSVSPRTRLSALKSRISMGFVFFFGLMAWHFFKSREPRVMSDEI
jgi:hypothetical protein